MNWKKIVAYIPCQVCFYIGHWTSMLIRFDCMSFLYPVYNRFMLWSCSTNDWAELDEWGVAPDSRLTIMIGEYIEMLRSTDRVHELKGVLWYDYDFELEHIDRNLPFPYHRAKPDKMTPVLKKKMRRELIGYKRQQNR